MPAVILGVCDIVFVSIHGAMVIYQNDELNMHEATLTYRNRFLLSVNLRGTMHAH